MENSSLQTPAPTTTPTTPHTKLRWYQFHLSTLFWLTILVAMLAANLATRNQLSETKNTLSEKEKEIEKIKQDGMMREAEPGYITQVGFGPGWIFRGDLPEGKWRLAVYFWNGQLKDCLDMELPPNLAPLAAIPIPDCKNVHIEVVKAPLPPNTMHEGKIARSAYEFTIYNYRNDLCSNTFSSGPILSPSDPGTIMVKNMSKQVADKKGIPLWRTGTDSAVDDHLLLQLEPIEDNSLPPQLNDFNYKIMLDTVFSKNKTRIESSPRSSQPTPSTSAPLETQK
jgi:hypothetical protein